MRIYFRSFLIIVSAIFFFCCISADKSVLQEPMGYVLMEAGTGSVLDAKNENVRMNAGYLSKLMSMIVVASHIDSGELSINEVLTASESVVDTKGSVIWLKSGDKITVDELLKAVIIDNANDAMTVLAERVSGNIDTFVMDMNAQAFELGLRDSCFVSPYGYADELEYTTAHDIAVICSKLAEYDFLQSYFNTWRDFIRNGKVELVSENTLTRTYELHIGFKACHSQDSGYFLAEGGRSLNGNTFIAVIFGAQNEDISFSKGKKLLKTAFSQYSVVSTEFPEEMLVPLKVKNGVDAAVEIKLREQGRAAVPKGDKNIRAKVVIPEYLTAPVQAGQSVGTAAFYNGDSLVFETDIITENAVSKLSWDYILNRTLYKMIGK